jgi:hypothetical protein
MPKIAAMGLGVARCRASFQTQCGAFDLREGFDRCSDGNGVGDSTGAVAVASGLALFSNTCTAGLSSRKSFWPRVEILATEDTEKEKIFRVSPWPMSGMMIDAVRALLGRGGGPRPSNGTLSLWPVLPRFL